MGTIKRSLLLTMVIKHRSLVCQSMKKLKKGEVGGNKIIQGFVFDFHCENSNSHDTHIKISIIISSKDIKNLCTCLILKHINNLIFRNTWPAPSSNNVYYPSCVRAIPPTPPHFSYPPFASPVSIASRQFLTFIESRSFQIL